MSQNTQAGPVPTLGDSSNVPADLLALAMVLGPQLCPPFATTAARDAAAATSAFNVCKVGSSDFYMRYGNNWYTWGAARQGVFNGSSLQRGNNTTYGTVVAGPFPCKVNLTLQTIGRGGYRSDSAAVGVGINHSSTVTSSSGHTVYDQNFPIAGSWAGVGYRPVAAQSAILGLAAGGIVTLAVTAAVSLGDALTYMQCMTTWTATPA